MSRVGRINRSLVALVAAYGLQVVTQVAVTPLYVVSWGAVTYGTWLSASAAVTYLAYADIGIMAYVLPRLMRHYSQCEWAQFDEEFHTASAAIAGIVLVLSTICVLVGAVLLSRHVNRELVLVAGLLAIQGLLAIVQSLIALPYSIASKPHLAYANGTLYAAALLFGNVVVLLLSGTPIELASVQAVLATTRTVLTWLHTRRAAPKARPGLRGAKLASVFALLPKSFERSLGNIGPLLSQQGTLLAIAGALGPGAAASLSTNRTLVNFSRVPQSMLSNAVYVEFAELHVHDNLATAARLLKLSAAATIAVTFSLVSTLFVYGPWLYTVWMRGRIATNETLLALLCVEALGTAPLYMLRTILLASNQHRMTVWIECCTTGSIVLLVALAANRFGVATVPIGILLVHVPVFGTVVGREVQRILGVSWQRRTIIGLFVKGIGAGLCGVGWCMAVARLPADPFVAACVGGAGALSIGITALWLWMLDQNDRRLVAERVTARLPGLRTLFTRWLPDSGSR